MHQAPRLERGLVFIGGLALGMAAALATSPERCRPVVVLELNLGSEQSFTSMTGFAAAFPSNYRFARLDNVGVRWSGGYRVVERELIPGASQHNVVAFPGEHAARILALGGQRTVASRPTATP